MSRNRILYDTTIKCFKRHCFGKEISTSTIEFASSRIAIEITRISANKNGTWASETLYTAFLLGIEQ